LRKALGLGSGISAVTIVGVAADRGVVVMMSIGGRVDRRLFNDPNVNDHIIAEVFISSNEGVAVFILKTDSL
jgi:hypothetical protein